MKILRLYLDTSVIGGYYDVEFIEPTRQLFARFAKEDYRALFQRLSKRN